MTSKNTDTYDVATSSLAYLYSETSGGDFVRMPLAKVANSNSISAGSVTYASAANTFSNLAIGSDGTALSVSAGLPVWANVTGATPFISASTFSGATSASFTSGFSPSTYDAYLFVLLQVATSSDADAFVIDVAIDGGTSWGTPTLSVGNGEMHYGTTDGLVLGGSLRLAQLIGSGNANACSGYLLLVPTATHVSYLTFTTYRGRSSSSGQPMVLRCAGSDTSASIVNAIRFRFGTGTMTGSIQMYGIKSS